MALEYMHDRISSGEFENKLPYVTRSEDPVAHKAYCEEEHRQYEAFKRAALDDVGLVDHAKRDLIFDRAWREGHACGHHEVYLHLCGLADFVADLERD